MVAPVGFLYRISLWLPGVTILFSLYALSGVPLMNSRPDSVGSFILNGMVFVIGGLCVSAAWDAVRLHGVAQTLNRKTQVLKLLYWVFLPCWLWGLAAYSTLWLYQVHKLGGFVFPHPWTFVLAMVLTCVWSLLGVVFAWVAPHVVGLLMATIVPFSVTSFAWSVTDSRWRHMFGVPTSCCELSAELDVDMVYSSLLCLVGLALLGSAATLAKNNNISPQIPRKIIAFLAFLGVACLFSASTMAKNIDNFAAAQPRSLSESVCNNELCYWPESSAAEVDANKAAYQRIKETMPAEWLPHNPNKVIMPSQNYKVGAIDLQAWDVGAVGDPLLFEQHTDPNLVYAGYARLMAARIIGVGALAMPSQQWIDWAVERTVPATEDEVLSWISSVQEW